MSDDAAAADAEYQARADRVMWAEVETSQALGWRTRAELEADTLAGLMFDRDARRLARRQLRQADFTTARNRSLYAEIMAFPDTTPVTTLMLARATGVGVERLDRWYLTASPCSPANDVRMLASLSAPPV